MVLSVRLRRKQTMPLRKFTGEVKSIESYGVFVDLGGVDGMVHSSELTWNRIKHPREIVKIGDKLDVYVKSFDPEKKRVSLGCKKEEDNPCRVQRRRCC